jgi:hypothetical protein
MCTTIQQVCIMSVQRVGFTPVSFHSPIALQALLFNLQFLFNFLNRLVTDLPPHQTEPPKSFRTRQKVELGTKLSLLSWHLKEHGVWSPPISQWRSHRLRDIRGGPDAQLQRQAQEKVHGKLYNHRSVSCYLSFLLRAGKRFQHRVLLVLRAHLFLFLLHRSSTTRNGSAKQRNELHWTSTGLSPSKNLLQQSYPSIRFALLASTDGSAGFYIPNSPPQQPGLPRDTFDGGYSRGRFLAMVTSIGQCCIR